MKRPIRLLIFIGCQAAAGLYPLAIQAQSKHELAAKYEWIGEAGFTGDGPGAPDKSLKSGHVFGIEYRHFFRDWLAIQTGVSYQKTDIIITSNLPPNVPKITSQVSLDILSVPLMAEVHFLKYLFAHAGLIFSIDAHNTEFNSQSGVGFGAGIGGQIRIGEHFRIYLNPMVSQYGTAAFSSRHQKLTQAGIKGGVAYSF